MAKSLSITVHPEPIKGEYLVVSDAMRQVLDLIEALEKSESVDGSDRKIVWRLTEAHTNSPPFTVIAEAFAVDPSISIVFEADRVADVFSEGLSELLEGHAPIGLDEMVWVSLKRAFERNTNGVGRTEIYIGEDRIDITPQSAKAGLIALEHLGLSNEATRRDWTRTEFGTVDGRIHSLTRWNEKPALVIAEWLSEQKFTCVLSSSLADELGPTHSWREAWAGKRVRVTGALHFNSDSVLKRVDADHITDVMFTDVTVGNLRKLDILEGRSVSEHLDLLRGSKLG